MTINARESRLWKKVKKGLNKCFLTRIESSTINGIPDIHAVSNTEVFWIELKSDEANYPKLNKWQIVWINKYIKAGGKVIILDETLSKRSLKLYRPVSSFTDPRSLVSFASFSFPLQWPTVQETILQELAQQEAAAWSRSRWQTSLVLVQRTPTGPILQLDLAAPVLSPKLVSFPAPRFFPSLLVSGGQVMACIRISSRCQGERSRARLTNSTGTCSQEFRSWDLGTAWEKFWKIALDIYPIRSYVR